MSSSSESLYLLKFRKKAKFYSSSGRVSYSVDKEIGRPVQSGSSFSVTTGNPGSLFVSCTGFIG